MSFSVSKSAPELVAPCEATPSGNLTLSAMDQFMADARVMVDLLLVFKQGQEPAKVMKDALAKALVPYYPVAGRLTDSNKDSEVEVACSGDGVWFVEASASCDLDDVNNLERPLMIPKEELVPFAPAHVNQEDLTFLMQVTNFKCGGFAVGIRFSHSMFDGLGVAQFLKAHSEMAMGLSKPTIEPVWAREAIPRPPKLSQPQGHAESPPFAAFKFENSTFDISVDHIGKIKEQYVLETGRRCSTFDVVTAIIWQCRTRAVGLKPDALVHLGFVANTRHLLHSILPKEGFYGNCVIPILIEATSEAIADASIVEVVSLIKNAKERMPSKFLAWLMGDPMVEDPYKVPLDYGLLAVSDWSRVGFSELDYGWGEPVHVVPLNDDYNLNGSCIYLRSSVPKLGGLRLMARCVDSRHLAAFDDQIKKFV